MSRAILIDERLEQEEEENVSQVVEDNFDEIEEPQQELQETFSEPEEEDLPEKYKGKSVKELARMHQEAEKLLGRHSSEVGELRKVVDQYIQAQLSQKQQEVEQEEDVDFFLDPDKAVSKAIENHPSIKQAKEYTEQARRTAALNSLKAKHPDMENIVQDENFAKWVQGSKIRTQLFLMADQGYDHEAADELFSLWKERQQTVQNTATVEKQARKEALKGANTGNARGSSEGSSKKKFRRVDLINLMKTDPDRYDALQPEIMRAYAEGRVI